MARKAGSLMRELRSVSNDFKSTWAQEVRLDENKESDFFGKQIDSEDNASAAESDVQTESPNNILPAKNSAIMPEVREVSEEDYKKLIDAKNKKEKSGSDKENWL
jgi:Sec-independent protein translocase protein TatA